MGRRSSKTRKARSKECNKKTNQNTNSTAKEECTLDEAVNFTCKEMQQVLSNFNQNAEWFRTPTEKEVKEMSKWIDHLKGEDGGEVIFIEISEDGKKGECMYNSARLIRNSVQKGKIVYGYRMYINGMESYRAEVHAVVVDENGNYFDPTPSEGDSCTCFLKSLAAVSEKQAEKINEHVKNFLDGESGALQPRFGVVYGGVDLPPWSYDKFLLDIMPQCVRSVDELQIFMALPNYVEKEKSELYKLERDGTLVEK